MVAKKIVMALAVVGVALATAAFCSGDSRVEDAGSRLRRLEAENMLLKSQIRSLKGRLAGSASKPSSTSVAAAVVLGLRSERPSFWRVPAEVEEQIAIRKALGARTRSKRPREWLEKNKGFVGREVVWELEVVASDILPKSVISSRSKANAELMEKHAKQLDDYNRWIAPGRTPTPPMKKGVERAKARLPELKAEAERLRPFLKSEGGVIFELALHEDGDLRVRFLCPARTAEEFSGLKNLKKGQRLEVRGQIKSYWLGDGGRVWFQVESVLKGGPDGK